MKYLPFFSVVVPTYNQLETLERTVAGLRDQTYPKEKYEIIVVDDGSQDGTLKYLEKCARLGELTYIVQQHAGPGKARNSGAQRAKGEIIAFIDHDCIPKRNWLERYAEFYKEHIDQPAYAVGGRIKPLPYDCWLYRFYRVQGKRHQNNQNPEPQYLDTANATFPKKIFWSVDGFNEIFPFACDDVELGLRLRLAGVELETCQRAIVWHEEPKVLGDLLSKSFHYGYGAGIMRAEYSDIFYLVPDGGLGDAINRTLGNWVSKSKKVHSSIRSPVVGCAVALREMAFWVPELRYFLTKYLVNQNVRYKRFNCGLSVTLMYLFLEFCDFLPQLFGRLVGLIQFSIQKTRNDMGE